MADKYAITVNNRSTIETAFFILVNPFEAESTGGSSISTKKATVFQRSDVASNSGNGQAVFRYDTAVFAVCQTGSPDSVTTTDFEPVQLGTFTQEASVVEVIYDSATKSGKFGEIKLAEAKDTPAGGFTMKTGTFQYPTPNKFSIGTGTRIGGQTIPLSMFSAKPNMTYNVFANSKYFLAAGTINAQPGEIIDTSAVSSLHPLEFEAGQFSVAFDYNTSKEFQPVVAKSPT